MSSTKTSEIETMGSFIVTFRTDAADAGLASLKKMTGITKSKIMSSSDFGALGVDLAQSPGDGGVLFQNLGVAVVNLETAAAISLARDISGGGSAILAIEPEGIMYALGDPSISKDYLRGFRDAAIALYERAILEESSNVEIGALDFYQDTSSEAWGLLATKANASKYSGLGIKVAVLDTGLDLLHPDFSGRAVFANSFIPGVSTVQDGHGHGTHCTGTACGPLLPVSGARYGVAHDAELLVGKVLSDQGSGRDGGILAGIDWAISNGSQIISMSLGADVTSTSTAYEAAGKRALDAGTLIVAAAGNNARRLNGEFGFVTRPANSRTFMAVGALANRLQTANFSSRDTVLALGTSVDIAGPGVDIYSSWPLPAQFNVISGTSMATPHVAGIAALWAEASGDRGEALWQRLISNAKILPDPVIDVGRGLVQAP
ncbi:S8 family serine peptidase [Pseudomonas sp. URMO17WK12:I11]|uniref:S8 family serine peptidase n=1 Tax=Pseudomonas sp. URMO17WK12:I11 TaxID=1283291 RepID=UPI000722B8DA|nr:S8 family serine peptidase [Pseudomonas sp. URMO17WK12:I11]CRL52384.1 Subtilisin DY [Pseudomonas sp. URMO17WK12:I11]